LASKDNWAIKQEDQPGRSEAIRRLVELGLGGESKLPKKTEKHSQDEKTGKRAK
jgi:hypothetical protein